jgi:hypothetical protein
VTEPAAAAVRVEFGGHEVIVRSNDPALLQAVQATFRHMPATGAASVAADLTVWHDNGQYRAEGPDGPCACGAALRNAIRWVRYETTKAIIDARKDLFWMHGAVAGWRGLALMLPGKRGRGKSTLVTALCQRGWTFLTDDIVPLDPATLDVLPFPRVPEVRHDPGREMPEGWLLEVDKAEISIDDWIQSHPLPVRGIVLPVARRTGRVTLEPCSPAQAVMEIAEGCWNFADHGERAVAILSRLVVGKPTMRLTFRSGRAAAERLIDWATETWPSDP